MVENLGGRGDRLDRSLLRWLAYSLSLPGLPGTAQLVFGAQLSSPHPPR